MKKEVLRPFDASTLLSNFRLRVQKPLLFLFLIGQLFQDLIA